MCPYIYLTCASLRYLSYGYVGALEVQYSYGNASVRTVLLCNAPLTLIRLYCYSLILVLCFIYHVNFLENKHIYLNWHSRITMLLNLISYHSYGTILAKHIFSLISTYPKTIDL